jgi:hypothetical protein
MYLLGLKYLEALPQITQGRGTTIFLPAEASGVMGSLGALREVLRAGGGAVGEARPVPAPSAGLGYPSATPKSPVRSLTDGGSGGGKADGGDTR